MVGFLGMMAAGGAMGARDTDVQNTRAQNELEMRNSTEALREEYLNRRFDKELSMKREDAQRQGLLKEQEYQRNRTDKLSDTAAEREFQSKKQAQDIEARKSVANTSAGSRLEAAKIRAQAIKAGRGEDDAEALTYTDTDGKVYQARTPQEKEIALMQRLGISENGAQAMKQKQTMGILGSAARDPRSFTEGTPATASRMVDQVYGSKPQQSSVLKYNPKTGKFD